MGRRLNREAQSLEDWELSHRHLLFERAPNLKSGQEIARAVEGMTLRLNARSLLYVVY
jgi:hypothetical protein